MLAMLTAGGVLDRLNAWSSRPFVNPFARQPAEAQT